MLQTVVHLALQLERDAACDARALRHRDRELGKSLAPDAATPVRQLCAWLQAVSVEEDRLQARYAAGAWRMLVVLLFLCGMLLGSSMAAAAFYYDGRQPINILPILAMFVGLPVLTLPGFVLAALPRSRIQHWPIIPEVQEVLAMLLAGMIGGLMRTLPQAYREALQHAAGRRTAYHRVYGHLHKWMLLTGSQTFALAFVLGALLWFGSRLVVTDLAFTWSTTLQTQEPEVLYVMVQRLTQTLSQPWAAFVPQAQPSAELIRETQYFRLQQGLLADSSNPAALGAWWPFLMLSMACYGLLPRLLTLAFCAWRYRRASQWCMLHTPGATDVLERLNSVIIETQSLETEAQEVASSGSAVAALIDDAAPANRSPALLINWAAVPAPEPQMSQQLAAHWGLDVQQAFQAGGRHSLEADTAIIAHVAQLIQQDPRAPQVVVLVMVKAWEPPMLDIIDFLSDLRQAIGAGQRIQVLALWIQQQPAESATEAALYVTQWQRKLATMGDPWLRVRLLTLAVSAVDGQRQDGERHDA